MYASKMFAYTDGVTNRPARSSREGSGRARLARAGRLIDNWTREAFNPRYPHHARR
ncbi:MAG: hypothetical protein ACRDRN_21945 [Sciscionella sp.]